LIFVLEFAIFREVVQRICGRFGLGRSVANNVATALAIALVTVLSVVDTGWIDAVAFSIGITVTLFVILHVGLLAVVVLFVVQAIALRVPLTLDGSKIHAEHAWLTIGTIVSLSAVALWLARAGEPLF